MCYSSPSSAEVVQTVKYFDEWVDEEGLVKFGTLQCLKGARIGIDAASFSRQFIAEPLLTALGGAPIALEGVRNALQNLLDADISLHFVFNGLQFIKVADPFAKPDRVNIDNSAAFAQYESQRPVEARRAFSTLGRPFHSPFVGFLKASYLISRSQSTA